MKTNTFKTFIEENYYDSICTRLNGFISTHPSFIREKINASVNVHHPELEDFTIEAVYIESGNDNKIEFDIVCNCNVNYEYVEYHGKYKNHDSDCMSDVWVVVHGRTSLSNLKKVYFYGAEEYVKNAIHKPLNGDMVPIIRLIKSVFKSEPEAYCFNPERADMELGDKVWILLKNMNEIESTRIDFLEDGSLKDYDSGIIYTPDEIAAVQRRIPYDLIGDPDFLKFCGR